MKHKLPHIFDRFIFTTLTFSFVNFPNLRAWSLCSARLVKSVKLVLGELIYGRNVVNLEQFGTKGFSTVFTGNELAERHSKILGKSHVAKLDFFIFKV